MVDSGDNARKNGNGSLYWILSLHRGRVPPSSGWRSRPPPPWRFIAPLRGLTANSVSRCSRSRSRTAYYKGVVGGIVTGLLVSLPVFLLPNVGPRNTVIHMTEMDTEILAAALVITPSVIMGLLSGRLRTPRLAFRA